MLDSLVPLIIMSFCLGVAAWMIYVWAVKTGQFDDLEGPKHRMLDDDDEIPPHPDPTPARRGDNIKDKSNSEETDKEADGK